MTRQLQVLALLFCVLIIGANTTSFAQTRMGTNDTTTRDETTRERGERIQREKESRERERTIQNSRSGGTNDTTTRDETTRERNERIQREKPVTEQRERFQRDWELGQNLARENQREQRETVERQQTQSRSNLPSGVVNSIERDRMNERQSGSNVGNFVYQPNDVNRTIGLLNGDQILLPLRRFWEGNATVKTEVTTFRGQVQYEVNIKSIDDKRSTIEIIRKEGLNFAISQGYAYVIDKGLERLVSEVKTGRIIGHFIKIGGSVFLEFLDPTIGGSNIGRETEYIYTKSAKNIPVVIIISGY
jgi:hypothetical protein